MRKTLYLGPLILFVIIAVYFAAPILDGKDPRILPSAMIEKPIPNLDLPPLVRTKPGIDNQSLTGNVRLVNFFSSWCGPCRTEHEFLMKIKETKLVPIYGINYKDNTDDAKGWLNMRGNPYRIIVADLSGDLSLDLGVYGVPETYIIDENQVILYKHIGPINNRIIQQEMMPLLGNIE